MYALFFLMAWQIHAGDISAPVWHDEYGLALREAELTGKPVAVVIGRGKNGASTIAKEGNLGPEVRKLLADWYICLYIDADRPTGQEWVDAFEAVLMPTLVLSDHSRVYQAYRHAGILDTAQFAQQLQKYRLPQVQAPPKEDPPASYCRT
jgi:hypothetical protein